MTALVLSMATKKILFEEEPLDWYIDESGEFHKSGRKEANVGDCIFVKYLEGLPKVCVRGPELT